jgi:hypothetical protein
MRAGYAALSRGSSILQLVMGTISQLLIKFTGYQDRARGRVEGPSFYLHFIFRFLLGRLGHPFSVSRSVFKLPHNYLAVALPHLHLLLFLRPSCCMEQRRMHSQQLSHNAHDAASFDISQPPFYPSFPGLELQGDSKVTQAPHLSPSYVQHQYAHDTGASLESGGSPPLSFRIHEQPQQGHPRLGGLALPPAPQYHQPCPTETYSVFTHDHGGHNPTPQVPSHQFPRAPPHPAHWPIDPRATGPFSDNATSPHTAPAAPRMGIPPIYSPPYALRPQPMYPLPTIHPSTPTHGPPEQSQRTTTPAPTAFHEQHEDRANIDHAQRSRSWGAGSLDPTTGVFSRASDHPRIRTAQACEKCRARKAKVSVASPSPPPPLPPFPSSFTF